MPFVRQLLTPFGLLRLESDQFLAGPELRDGDIIAARDGHFENTAAAQTAQAATGHDLLKSVPNYSTLTPELVMSVVTSHL
jgi:hypothetical protein